MGPSESQGRKSLGQLAQEGRLPPVETQPALYTDRACGLRQRNHTRPPPLQLFEAAVKETSQWRALPARFGYRVLSLTAALRWLG